MLIWYAMHIYSSFSLIGCIASFYDKKERYSFLLHVYIDLLFNYIRKYLFCWKEIVRTDNNNYNSSPYHNLHHFNALPINVPCSIQKFFNTLSTQLDPYPPWDVFHFSNLPTHICKFLGLQQWEAFWKCSTNASTSSINFVPTKSIQQQQKLTSISIPQSGSATAIQ